MKNYLENATKFLIYCTFFVPLIVLPSSFIFPFIVPKILVLGSLIFLMATCYGLLLYSNWQEYKWQKKGVLLAVTAFVLSFGLSTFFGTDTYHSFWDNHERMLGLFTILHYFIFFLVSTKIFKTWTDWKWAFRIFLIAGSLVMLIGVRQIIEPEYLLNMGSTRVASSLGNSIYVGGYGLFLAIFSYLLAVKEKNNLVWRVAEVVIGILGILGMIFSGTRGSMLGFGAAIVVGVIGYGLVFRRNPRIRNGLLVLAVSAILLFAGLFSARKTEFVQKIPALDRTLNTSFYDVKSSARWIAWEIAVESWKERPIFGWGPNNYFYAFNKYYNPRSLEFGYGETWFDNAHNILLNTLSVQGIIGLLSYLSIFGVSIFVLINAFKKNNIDVHILVVTSAFLVAHLIQNITVFENPTSYLYFMFVLAFVNSISEPHTNKIDDGKKNDKRIGSGLAVSAFCFAAIFIFIVNIQPARANMITLSALRIINQTQQQIDSGAPVSLVESSMVPAIKEALEFNSPHIDDIRNDISRQVSIFVQNKYDKIGKDEVNKIISLMIDENNKNLLLHPLDIRIFLSLSQLNNVKGQVNQDINAIISMQKNLLDALKLSPRRQQVAYNLADLYARIGKINEAVSVLRMTIDDNPKIHEGYIQLASLYAYQKQSKNVTDILAEAEKNGIVFNDLEKDAVSRIVSSVTVTSTKVKK